MRDARSLILGVDEPVPTLEGRLLPYVNLDNAATTPPFVTVMDAIERFLPYYSSVHRGTGYKSRLSTRVYEEARDTVGRFVGADAERDVTILARNTTEAINKLARVMPIADGAVVLTTLLEHHSNDLPWRARARTVLVRACPDGSLDEDDLDRHLSRHAGRVALVAVSGASNVTGFVQPVHRLAEKVHHAGGRILVDAAQLAAPRPRRRCAGTRRRRRDRRDVPVRRPRRLQADRLPRARPVHGRRERTVSERSELRYCGAARRSERPTKEADR